jgi:hypothetical protein
MVPRLSSRSLAKFGAVGLFATVLTSIGIAIAGCAPPPPEPNRARATSSTPRLPESSAPIKGQVVGHFDAKTFGPRLVMSDAGEGSVSWLTISGTGSVLTHAHLSAGGALSPAAHIADGPRAPRFFEVELGLEGDTFFLVGSGGAREGASTLDLYILPKGGTEARAEQVVSAGQVSWASVIPSLPSPLVFWSETARGEAAELWVRPIVHGALGAPERVAASATAWQVKSFGNEVGLAFAPGPGEVESLVLLAINGEGHVVRRRTLGEELPQVTDVDFVREGPETLVVFTGVTERGPRLYSLRIDLATGEASPAEPLTRQRGPQLLHRLEVDAEKKRTFVAWDEGQQDPEKKRRVLVAELRRGQWVEPTWVLEEPEGEAVLPLFEGQKPGLLGVKHRPLAPGLEWFRLGNGPLPTTRPLELAGLIPAPELAWDLHCSAVRCLALGAASTEDLTVFLANEEGAESFVAIEPQGAGPNGVALVSDELLLSLPSLAAFARVPRLGHPSEWLVSTLTDFDARPDLGRKGGAAKDGRMAPERAHLALWPLIVEETADTSSEKLARLGKEFKVSVRAQSLGGVALSAMGPSGGLLGWSALDNGYPHVFLTALDAYGKKSRQVMLPEKGSEISDLTVLAAGTGYLVAWVDTREGVSMVFVAQADATLNHITKPELLRFDVFAANQLVLRAEPGRIELYYTSELEELSELATERRRGIFRVAVDAVKGAFVGEPTLLYETGNNLHSLTVLDGPGRGRLGWLETEGGSALAQAGRLFVAPLLDGDRPLGKAIEIDKGVLTFGGNCSEVVCRFGIVKREGSRDALFALEAPFDQLSPNAEARLLYLAGFVPPSTPPVVMGATIVYPMTLGEGRVELRAAKASFRPNP